MLVAVGTAERPQTEELQRRRKERQLHRNQMKDHTWPFKKTKIYDHGRLNFLSLEGLGFALIWPAWVGEQLSLPSAVCCSSLVPGTAALHRGYSGAAQPSLLPSGDLLDYCLPDSPRLVPALSDLHEEGTVPFSITSQCLAQCLVCVRPAVNMS